MQVYQYLLGKCSNMLNWILILSFLSGTSLIKSSSSQIIALSAVLSRDDFWWFGIKIQQSFAPHKMKKTTKPTHKILHS